MPAQRHEEQELPARLLRLALAIGIGYLFVALFRPFFSAIAWAAILCYALYPVHRRLARLIGGRQTASAFVMCIAVTVVLILPILYLSFQIGTELTSTYTTVADLVETGEGLKLLERWRDSPLLAAASERLREYERLTGKDVRAVFTDNLTTLGSWLVEQLTHVATNVLLGLVELVFTLLCMFFFFRDGESLVTWLQAVLPFSLERQQLVLRRFHEVVTGSIYGNAAVAGLEGLVGGMAFFAVGLPSPVLWGAIMGILAYLPAAGASLVWIPAALYLFFASAYLKMAVICVAGVMIAFTDGVVRNALVATRVQLHPLLVFFSVLGGIQLFGLVGIVAGPLVVAVGRTFVEVYRMEKTGALAPELGRECPSQESRA